MPFIYPQNFEIQAILPDLLGRARDGRIGLDLFPAHAVNAAQVRWAQQDNYFGLQQLRGLDGAVARAARGPQDVCV